MRNSWNVACTILETKGIDDIVKGQNTKNMINTFNPDNIATHAFVIRNVDHGYFFPDFKHWSRLFKRLILTVFSC